MNKEEKKERKDKEKHEGKAGNDEQMDMEKNLKKRKMKKEENEEAGKIFDYFSNRDDVFDKEEGSKTGKGRSKSKHKKAKY